MGAEDRIRILVVDDDPTSLAALSALLAGDGYRITVARGGREALLRIARDRPDCVVLDYAMPEMTGLEVLRSLRASGDQIPVLMLSAKSDPYDKTAGYSSGADVYVGKDEDPSVVRAAIQRLLNRAGSTGSRIEIGGLVIDSSTWSCHVDGRQVRLPPRSFSLLLALASQAGRVCRKEQLIYQVWGVNSDVYTRAVDNAVVELRRLLGDDSGNPRFIHTVRGV
ncbi:MAG: response regulator transcription factor, partial [Candidatus Dormibacteraeota bacterium]|nr:response regulator transcription factor [Candidatus Dormibacteraeota bacterium]